MLTYDNVVELVTDNLKQRYGRNYIETCRMVVSTRNRQEIACIPSRNAIKNQLLNGNEVLNFVPPHSVDLTPVSHLYKNKELVTSM
jgi:hypothetical protein